MSDTDTDLSAPEDFVRAGMGENIKLGVYAEEQVSKIRGHITAHHLYKKGNVQWQLTPASVDKRTLPESLLFDPDHILVIGPGVPVRSAEVQPFHNGDVVEDITTGVKGIVTRIMTYMNGCVFLSVQPSHTDNKGKLILDMVPRTETIVWQDAKLIKAATLPKAAVTKKADKPPGGPPSRVPARTTRYGRL